MAINTILSLLTAMAIIVGISGCATTSTDGKNQPHAYEHGHKDKQHYACSNHNQYHGEHRGWHYRSMGYSLDSNRNWIVDEKELEEGLAKIADARETRMREHIQKRNERILKYHDTDKDGKLNDAEREAVKKQWQERRTGWAETHEQWRKHHKEGSHRETRKYFSHRRGHGKGSRGKSHWGHILSFVMGIDKDHDGIIDDAEFEAAFVSLEELMKRHKDHFFKRIDTDGDGILSMDERKAMHKNWDERTKHSRSKWHAWSKTWMHRHGEKSDKDKKAMKERIHGWTSRMARVRNAFVIKRFDTNNDGKLTGDEMTTAREKIGHFRNDFKHFGEMMKTIDKNDDLMISEKELEAAMAEHKAKRERKKEEMLAKYDKDKDGKLNEDERKATHIAGKDKWESKRKAMQDYWAKRLDVNKDDKMSSKEIDDFYDARKDSFKKSLKTMVAMSNDYLVKKYDSNKDGSLSKDERGKAMSRWREKMKAYWQKHRKSQDED